MSDPPPPPPLLGPRVSQKNIRFILHFRPLGAFLVFTKIVTFWSLLLKKKNILFRLIFSLVPLDYLLLLVFQRPPHTSTNSNGCALSMTKAYFTSGTITIDPTSKCLFKTLYLTNNPFVKLNHVRRAMGLDEEIQFISDTESQTPRLLPLPVMQV